MSHALTCIAVHLAAVAVAADPADIKYIDPAGGMSQAVVVGPAPLVHTSQVYAVDNLGIPLAKQPHEVHAARVLENLDLLLKESGSSLSRAVKLNVYAISPEVVETMKKQLTERFPKDAAPAVSFVVGKLGLADAPLCLDAVAVADGGVKRVLSKHLPKEPGRSHAVIAPAGPLVYVSGQAERGKSLAQATRKTLESLRKSLKHLDLDLQDVIQVKSFLSPMKEVATVQHEMHEFFGANLPAQVYVEWTYPQIEIELIASARPTREKPAETVDYITPPGMNASPIYSRIARVNHGKLIYVSGLFGAGDTGEAQVKDIFRQLDGLLKKSGSDLRHMAKATYYVATDDASKKLNELRPNYYDPKRPPSASKAGVTGTGVKDRGITLDMIAVTKP